MYGCIRSPTTSADICCIVFSKLSERGRNQQGPFQTDKRLPAELNLFSSLRVIGYL